MKITITQLSVHEDADNPVHGDSAICVSMDDEGGGLYLRLSNPASDNGVAINPTEWPHVAGAVERILNEIRSVEDKP